MNISDIITLVGTVGGIQGLIEIGKWWQNRKLDRRKEEADVKATENQVTRSQIDWLEKRLAERDAKIDAIYAELAKSRPSALAKYINAMKPSSGLLKPKPVNA